MVVGNVYTQTDLAVRLGVERSTVWWWVKKGKVQPDIEKDGKPALFSEAKAQEIAAWFRSGKRAA